MPRVLGPLLRMICNVCLRKLGGKYNQGKDTCSVVVDPLGNEKRVHHGCVRDSDGKFVRKELVPKDKKS